MPIGTNALIDFFGTQDEVTVASPSSVAAGAYSVTADVNTWTNDDDAPEAFVVADFTFGTAPTVGGTVLLFARLMDIQSTNDAPVPDANYEERYLGRFVVDNVTTSQFVWEEIALPNSVTSQVYEFYIKNQAGQAISAGWSLWVTPKTVGPHA